MIKRPAWRLAIGWLLLVLVAFLAVPAVAYLARGHFGHGPGSIDEFVRSHLMLAETPSLSLIAFVLSSVGSVSSMLVIGAVAAIWLWRSCGRAAGIVFLAPAAAQLLNASTKMLAQRPRPIGGADHTSSSFPSGHTATSTAVLLTLAFVLHDERKLSKRTAVIAGVLGAFLVGASRLYRDVHWATDVIGGWAVGALVAIVCIIVYKHLRTS